MAAHSKDSDGGHSATLGRIPAHLRRFVVEQDYAGYDEIDQAVWRFTLLQTYARLRETAHPAYGSGLAETGIGVERIPRIREMDACLSDYGWGAVAVDGFIPPRAFQEFQALGIMTIAAEIRRAEHLAYTPAPDIVHESAGHSPIIPDPEYRAYLRRIGEVGARAFSSPDDRRVYDVIHRLSELKEDRAAESGAIAAAEAGLERALAAARETTEAARLSRLHWWTVEYGLVGRPADYKLYGAGLLSSLGESHFCHDPSVRKLPLSADCVEVDYDITRPQPQLFVAESFAQLGAVLDDVAAGLAWRRGGALGVRRALESEEVATLELDSGLELIGVPRAVEWDGDDAAYLSLGGPCALARGGRILPEHTRERHPEGYGTPLGPLDDASELHRLREADLRARADRDGQLALRYRSGVRVQGRLERVTCAADGCVALVTLSACRVVRGDAALFDPDWGAFDLASGTHVRSAYAGPSDASYWPESEPSRRAVPRRKQRAGAEASLLDLYREALELWEQPDRADLVPRFERLHGSLSDWFPDEWLLAWNLLECLRKKDRGPDIAAKLRAHLLQIETRFPRDAPISMGLRYLDANYPGNGER